MNAPPIFICERTGRWAAAIRAAFAGREMPATPVVVETRSTAELQTTIIDRRRRGLSAGPVVIELTSAEAERTCNAFAWHVRRGDDVPLVVAATDGDGYEPAIRAAGATLFVGSLREVERILDLYVAYVADAAN